MDTPTALARLKASEGALRKLGVSRLSLFGSVARGEAGPHNDIPALGAACAAMLENLENA